MATSPRSDLILLRKETKARLAAAKGEATFEDAVAVLLDETPPERLAALLAARRAPSRPRPSAPTPRRPGAAQGPDRSPEKQVLVARLAAERRRIWEETGRIERIGPRRTRLNLTGENAPAEGRSVIRVVRRPPRG